MALYLAQENFFCNFDQDNEPYHNDHDPHHTYSHGHERRADRLTFDNGVCQAGTGLTVVTSISLGIPDCSTMVRYSVATP